MPQNAGQLSHDPGRLPTKPAPRRGQKIVIRVAGYPPFKEVGASLRNPKHPHYDRFARLRKSAGKAMRRRRWSEGAIALNFTMFAPGFEKGKGLVDYVGGIEDTLDGSHGFTFTYLPIVFQDDCQVCRIESLFKPKPTAEYTLEIEFLR
jgi:hypothetical protein